MSELDLWEDDELELDDTFQLGGPKTAKQKIVEKVEEGYYPVPKFDKPACLKVFNDKIVVFSKVDLEKHAAIKKDLTSLFKMEKRIQDNHILYICKLGAINAFVLRYVLSKVKPAISSQDAAILKESADKLWIPRASLSDDGKHIEYRAPNIDVYTDIAKKVGGYPTKTAWKINTTRVLDFETLVEKMETTLPKPIIAKEVLALTRSPLAGFDGSLDSLKQIPLSELNVISANYQTHKNTRTSKKTIEEKMHDFGIQNLHDLLFYLPKKFIDKSNPQELEYLIEGEAVTVVGHIAEVNSIPNNMGVYFEIENARGKSVKCNFWRQAWLKSKFKVGDEVLLTGKASWFRKRLELGGSSIEHLDEAVILPIVPVYKQSESKGITTKLIMAANRELLSRAGEISLPPYLKGSDKMTYTEALTELHFPSSVEMFREACDNLAYYELVYMQIILQEERSNAASHNGVVQQRGETNLQNKAAKLLPFRLTGSQVAAIKKLDRLLADDKPSQSLLNADVGAGKTLVAQMACMRTVESGHQAVIIGPTEILARQLYDTLEKQQKTLLEAGEQLSIAFLGSSMKAAQKKPIIAGLADGSIDIVVGTTSVIGDKVKYHSLGLVCVDEQQKFGAAQRTKLLSSRGDGKVPDLLLMSATPIPRSTAQVFYGDMELIELSEKPPGRLPIVTEWIEEDPIDFSHQLTNPVWTDVQNEAARGNQTFVITPMVADSDKVDAASVERTFKNLSESTLAGLSVGFVHGGLKADAAREIMADFKAKKYDVLVASTVVEVGVDIPDATRVVILSADRLGASSLHQIRGRVGRSNKQSKCYLVSMGKTDNSRLRLQSLVDSENGYDIALSDLSVRGQGKIFGSEQSGSSEMIFASLARHKDWIQPAKEEAEHILKSPLKKYALMDARDKFGAEERLF